MGHSQGSISEPQGADDADVQATDQPTPFSLRRHRIAFGESSEFLRNKRRHETRVAQLNLNEPKCDSSGIFNNVNFCQGLIEKNSIFHPEDMSVLNEQEVAGDLRYITDENLDFPISEVAMPEMKHDIKYVFEVVENPAANFNENSSSSASASGSNDVGEGS